MSGGPAVWQGQYLPGRVARRKGLVAFLVNLVHSLLADFPCFRTRGRISRYLFGDVCFSVGCLS